MLIQIKKAWNQYILIRHAIPNQMWSDTVAKIPVVERLSEPEQDRLRKLATVFLHQKTINGADGFVIEDTVRIVIAAQACLLILNLDIDHFKGWHEVIVYPSSFVATHREIDQTGLVSERRKGLSGEAWLRGPVILSWTDVTANLMHCRPGSNVVLHEFAHKLDMLNGVANGMPPLHREMAIKSWTDTLSDAFATLNRHIESHHPLSVDSYAGTNPAEFFAVFSEVFFEQPLILNTHYPDVYDQFRAYYRQDPLIGQAH